MIKTVINGSLSINNKDDFYFQIYLLSYHILFNLNLDNGLDLHKIVFD